MVVDLPAPLGPTNPVTSPGLTENDRPSRASAGPNRLRAPTTSILAVTLVTVRIGAASVVTPGSQLLRPPERDPPRRS